MRNFRKFGRGGNAGSSIFTAGPSVAGGTTMGSVLTLTVSVSAGVITRQWLRDNVTIAGQTGATYTTVGPADYDKNISCLVFVDGVAKGVSNSIRMESDGGNEFNLDFNLDFA